MDTEKLAIKLDELIKTGDLLKKIFDKNRYSDEIFEIINRTKQAYFSIDRKSTFKAENDIILLAQALISHNYLVATKHLLDQYLIIKFVENKYRKNNLADGSDLSEIEKEALSIYERIIKEADEIEKINAQEDSTEDYSDIFVNPEELNDQEKLKTVTESFWF